MSIPIGNMLWRIGEILGIDEQLAWTRSAGFDGVGFHASAGVPGVWRGVEPAVCDPATRERLRSELSHFSYAEIHAPFSIELRHDTLEDGLAALAPVLGFAGDVGAGVVTVHARLTPGEASCEADRWLPAMCRLSDAARRAGTTVALETVDGFDLVASWQLPHVGVNLDVGHMYVGANRHVLDAYGGIGGLIRHIGDSLVHLHLHDVVGETDHCEIGTGMVDYSEIVRALRNIGYARGMTLELNPDRVSPAGIRRSLAYVAERLRDADHS